MPLGWDFLSDGRDTAQRNPARAVVWNRGEGWGWGMNLGLERCTPGIVRLW